MPTHPRPHPRRTLTLTLAATLTLTLTLTATTLALAPATAGADTVGTVGTATLADDTLGPRLERACLRIPNLEIRTRNLIERLDGDATVRGSLAWLETRADAARDAGRDQMATVLENRLDVRSATRTVLDLRVDELARLRSRCTELGVDL